MSTTTVPTVRQQAESCRHAFLKLAAYPHRDDALDQIADALERAAPEIGDANRRDLEAASGNLAAPLMHRLKLDGAKLQSVIAGIRQIAGMPDPVGVILDETELDTGLVLRKVQTPIGVIAAIFESRPDVVPQIAALALKTGNGIVLKGGREAAHTNATLVRIIRGVLDGHGLGNAVQLVPTREAVAELLGMDDIISLVVPRGSNEMVRHIQHSTRIPVLGHADGICHVFIDESADPDMADAIVVDAKTEYPAACNSVETILVHSGYGRLHRLLAALIDAGVEVRACARTVQAAPVPGLRAAEPHDFGKEFSDLIVAVKLVDSLDAAIEHIHQFGSSHTEAIVTQSEPHARRFLNEVDSAGVYWNASTRFADGYRYGFGAEVGISTNRTHARGPVGIDGLLIYKYQLTGNGHVVADYTGKHPRAFLHRKTARPDRKADPE